MSELALRGRILDQAQRFLLTLALHDPSRRAKCAEEARRHGLSLGNERRQWLFRAVTGVSGVSMKLERTPQKSTEQAVAAEAAAAVSTLGGGGPIPGTIVTPAGVIVTSNSNISGNPALRLNGSAAGNNLNPAIITSSSSSSGSDGVSIARENNLLDGGGEGEEKVEAEEERGERHSCSCLTAKALEAGGDVLFAEVRTAAPAGYFKLRGEAGNAISRCISAGKGGGEGAYEDEEEEEVEETLDWAFDAKEVARVARGTNTDLVLLEVVMVMLKEQVFLLLLLLLYVSFFGGERKRRRGWEEGGKGQAFNVLNTFFFF